MSASPRGIAPNRASAPAGNARAGRRALLLVRGALSASALGLYTLAGVAGTFLALLPAAFPAVPRGRRVPRSAPLPAAAAAATREPMAG